MAHRKHTASEYCAVEAKPEKRLSELERLTFFGREELRRFLRLSKAQFGAFSLQIDPTLLQIERLRAAHALYGTFQGQDATLFHREPHHIAPYYTTIHGIPGGEVVDLQFVSNYKPHCDESQVSILCTRENREVSVRWWRHQGSGHPAVVAINGLKMGDHRISALAFLPGMLYRLGFDVLIYELPLHGSRTPMINGVQTKQLLFPSADPFLTNEGIAQAIYELRVVKKVVEGAGASAVGWMGMSLGSYLGLLWSGIERFPFALAAVPFSSIGDFAWKLTKEHAVSLGLRKGGVTKQFYRELFAPNEPENFNLKVEPKQTVIVGGLADKLIAPATLRRVAAMTGGAEILRFRGGHGAPFSERAQKKLYAYFKRVAAGYSGENS